MVDQEVEEILKQIRDTVKAEEQQINRERFELKSQNGDLTSPSQPSSTYPSISTMARAWDRLPPVISNRQGALAALELWLKRVLERGSRWFTWEQINFNAAVHHTFREMVSTLAIYEEQITNLRTQLAETNAHLLQLQEQQTSLRSELEPYKTETRTLSRSTAELTKALAELKERVVLRTQLDFLAKEREVLVQERDELRARTEQSFLEFKELNEMTLDEQRVSFKQIALQINETAANNERELRALVDRIANLEGAPSAKATGRSE